MGAADHASRGSIGTEGGRRGALRRVLTRRALGHWQTSPALASKPRGARYLDRGTSRWNSRAPARQGPSPEERHPVYPQRFNWFESTPRNAPRLPIQTNNHTTSEPHTHVMSNENKFPLKETPIFAKNKTPDRRNSIPKPAFPRVPPTPEVLPPVGGKSGARVARCGHVFAGSESQAPRHCLDPFPPCISQRQQASHR